MPSAPHLFPTLMNDLSLPKLIRILTAHQLQSAPSMSPSLWITASWIFSNFQNSTSSVMVSFWYGFSFQTSLLDNQRCFNWGHMNDEGLWGWVSQLYDPTGIIWKILCMSINAFSGSRDFHQFLKPRLLPSRCLLLPVCPHLKHGLWAIAATLQPILSILTPKPGSLDVWTPWGPWRKRGYFLRPSLKDCSVFVFFPRSQLRGRSDTASTSQS